MPGEMGGREDFLLFSFSHPDRLFQTSGWLCVVKKGFHPYLGVRCTEHNWAYLLLLLLVRMVEGLHGRRGAAIVICLLTMPTLKLPCPDAISLSGFQLLEKSCAGELYGFNVPLMWLTRSIWLTDHGPVCDTRIPA